MIIQMVNVYYLFIFYHAMLMPAGLLRDLSVSTPNWQATFIFIYMLHQMFSPVTTKRRNHVDGAEAFLQN